MQYQDALEWLNGLETMGIKLGLSNIRELLTRLGDPHKEFRSVHVGGTNGKGSVSAMSASILRAQGYRTGLYTSPHLIDFRERIRVDGAPIPRRALGKLASEVQGQVEDICLAHPQSCPTFFEATTALAFLHFAEAGAEVAVVEVGMGGRLDATNVIVPECSVITRIGLEHTDYLGDTIDRIAAEKAGIIKAGVPVITAEEGPGPLSVILSKARELDAPLKLVREGVDYQLVSFTLDGTRVSLPWKDLEVTLPLLGSYQASNAAMAARVMEALESRGWDVGEAAIEHGFANVRWPGRLEMVHRTPRLILDATHTPQGAEAVSEDLRRLVTGDIILVIGVLNDKDLDGVIAPFARLASKAIAVAPLTTRAYPKETVRDALLVHLREAEVASSVADGLRVALDRARPEDTVLVTGSIYTLGEAKAWWEGHEGR
jgi:dihydrofolate synthase/folylpolyglutamate synthase